MSHRWHGYFGIEDLNLTANQRAILIDVLRNMGPRNDPQPAYNNHWRTRLDNQAAIFEANFLEDNLTIQRFKEILGNIFNVDPDTIDHDTNQVSFSPGGNTPLVTFIHGGQNKIRVALFGGVGAAWQGSRREVLGYIKANLEDWEEPPT
jgi:hypothetical protein